MLNTNPTAQNCIDMLGKLVAFDTTSRNSNLELIEFVREQLSAIGVNSRLTFNDEKPKRISGQQSDQRTAAASCCPATPMSCRLMVRTGRPIRLRWKTVTDCFMGAARRT